MVSDFHRSAGWDRLQCLGASPAGWSYDGIPIAGILPLSCALPGRSHWGHIRSINGQAAPLRSSL